MATSIPGVLAVNEPKGPMVLVVSDSPHSGAEHPDDFGSIMLLTGLKVTEDALVDRRL